MKIKTLIQLSVILLMGLYTTGCFSSAVLRESKDKIALRRAIQSNNADNIKKIRNGGHKSVASDITFLDAINEQKAKLGGAVALDIGTAWAGYEAIRYISDEIDDDNNDNDGSSNGNNISGRDTTIINGDHNVVNNGSESVEGFSDGPQVVPVN